MYCVLLKNLNNHTHTTTRFMEMEGNKVIATFQAQDVF